MAVRNAARSIAVLALAAVLLSALGAWIAWSRLQTPYKGYTGDEQFVTIRAGAGAGEIVARLAELQVIEDDRLFRVALWWTGRGRSLQAGEYRFDRPVNAFEVIDRLARGDVYTRQITFPEGLTIEAMSKLFESHAFGPASDFLAAARAGDRIADLDPAATDLEGYLFPETYALPRTAVASQLVELMVDRFRQVCDAAMRAHAREQGLTLRQVVTLASLVEKETARADERPMVAAVYRNRLRIGMPMQADPTVVYALEKAHRYDGNIRRDDLDVASPYNTYRYPGLPPGPIAAPGKAALEAALSPAAIKSLYFVSRNDGSHVFADTLAQHNANVQRYQVEFFRARRGR